MNLPPIPGVADLLGIRELLGENLSDVKHCLKAEHEIEAYMVDATLTEVDKAVHLLSSPRPEQVEYVHAHLARIAATDPSAAKHTLLPRLSKRLVEQSSAVLQQLGQQWQQMIESTSPSIFTNKEAGTDVLPVVLQVMNRSRDQDVLTVWQGVLLALVRLLPLSVVRTQLVDFAMRRCDLSETACSRAIGCRTLGACIPSLDQERLSGHLLARAIDLCQDTDGEVRIAMADQLAGLAKAVGAQTTEEKLLPELLELLDDEESAVQIAAFAAMIAMMPVLSKTIRLRTILPLLARYCKHGSRGISNSMVEQFGPLLVSVASDLTDAASETTMLLEYFRAACSSEQVHRRRLCAYNFPAVLQSLGPRRWSQLSEAHMRLLRDQDPDVRRCIAASMHEVCSLLGRERCVKGMRDALILLLRDASVPLAAALLQHLDTTLGCFAVPADDVRATVYTELLPHILALQQRLASQWRLVEQLVAHYRRFPDWYTTDQIYDRIIPGVLRLMLTGPQPLRSTAACTLCHLIRRLRRASQRSELCVRLIDSFAKGNSYTDRLLFITTCQHLLDIFSRLFFKENFFQPVLQLARDPVPNVRLKLCRMLPDLKRILKIPNDASLLHKLDECVSNLKSDADRDVVDAAIAAASEMSRYEPKLSRESALQSIDEIVDRKKEEEERLWPHMDLGDDVPGYGGGGGGGGGGAGSGSGAGSGFGGTSSAAGSTITSGRGRGTGKRIAGGSAAALFASSALDDTASSGSRGSAGMSTGKPSPRTTTVRGGRSTTSPGTSSGKAAMSRVGGVSSGISRHSVSSSGSAGSGSSSMRSRVGAGPGSAARTGIGGVSGSTGYASSAGSAAALASGSRRPAGSTTPRGAGATSRVSAGSSGSSSRSSAVRSKAGAAGSGGSSISGSTRTSAYRTRSSVTRH